MKILLVTSRYPWPPRRGDQMRALQLLDFLAAEHEVTLLAPAPGKDQPSVPEATPYRIELYRPGGRWAFVSGLARTVFANLPLQAGLFYHPDLGRRIRELAPRHDLGILQLVRLALHVRDFGSMPIVVDLIDSLSLNVSLRASVDRWWLAPVLRIEARRLASAERRLAERAERLLVVSERDRQALVDGWPPDLAARTAVVGLTVGERPAGAPAEPESLGRQGEAGPLLVMTGNLGYFVNADAVAWWLAEVWPQLRQVRPDVRLVVAGDRPAPALRRAVEGAGARLVESPRDLRSILAQATIALAPMRCGSGVPVKVLEAWAVGVPVLASAWAAAGTSGRPGEDLILVGRHADEWVAAVTELLDSPSARRRLVENGGRRLAADYSPETVRRQLLGVIRALDAAGGRAGAASGVLTA
jgi:glycosyltransferase involved in cell wall biosynthesis